ncbi:hypothetical protein [Nitritalea halalkaliphila]|uniref:hypothetical protein n=1 Tax=Nitritalea halalkaliphila TaxID=590849 RepID=UPI0002EBC5F9|nr:hypothetical protein [Nitritalea halalkaliphila]
MYARIDTLNAQDNYSFNECFHGLSELPCGVAACTWSAAGQVLLYQGITNGFSLST